MTHPPQPNSSQTLSIVTINVWFGLEERGILKMKPLESEERRETRYQVLVEEMRNLEPDIIAVQEANPIPQYSRRLARDLGYGEIHQVYNGGIKLGKLGIPINLRMGLLVLAKRNLCLRWVDSRRISGDRFGIHGDLLCFHLKDSRFVMAGEVSVKGRRIYIIHTHTYPGLPEDREIYDLLQKYCDERNISDRTYQTYLSTLGHIAQRQRQETQGILHFLKKTCDKEPSVLVGDFNMTEDNAFMVHLTEEGGLWDTYRIANPESDGVTWDSDHNENTKFMGGISSDRAELQDFYQYLRAQYDRKSRRIDYILLNSAFTKEQILESRIVLDRPVNGVHASDHYGVMTALSF